VVSGSASGAVAAAFGARLPAAVAPRGPLARGWRAGFPTVRAAAEVGTW
jgi:hypothetical protein